MERTRWVWCAADLLLLFMMTEVALSTRQNSLSWDQGDHIFSGYMNWKLGEYDLNPEYPPLVKLIATLPLLPLELRVAPRQCFFSRSSSCSPPANSSTAALSSRPPHPWPWSTPCSPPRNSTGGPALP